jgi:hypothetical protein
MGSTSILPARSGVNLGYDEYGALVALVIEADPHWMEIKLSRAEFEALRDALTRGLARDEAPR